MITDVIDVAHYESAGNVAAAASQGLVALWAKTGQGVNAPDASFSKFEDDAKSAGILFGAYHFGTNQHPGDAQADDCLRYADPRGIIALDWETEPAHSNTMTLAQAEEFVSRIHEVTGRWPVLYSGRSFLDEHNIPSSSVLGHCPLWLAQYGEEPHHIPTPWARYDLWQYSDVANGPHDQVTYPRHTPGFGVLVDRSAFRGTFDELRSWWANAGR